MSLEWAKGLKELGVGVLGSRERLLPHYRKWSSGGFESLLPPGSNRFEGHLEPPHLKLIVDIWKHQLETLSHVISYTY